MSNSWNTKWGARRVRHDPPTFAEALAAAQGLTSDRTQQACIAAGLMGISVADAETEMRRAKPACFATETRDAGSRATSTRGAGLRKVIVVRKTSRRFQPGAERTKDLRRPF